MTKDSKILGPSKIPSDKELQEIWDEHLMEDETKPKLKFKVGDIIAKAHLRFRIVKVESDRYIVEGMPGINLEVFFTDQDKYRLVKEEGITTVAKAAEVFAEMLVELCPELLGFGGAAKEWENEFRKRLEE